MAGFPELVVLSAVMGLSIYLSLPIVLAKSIASRTIALLNAIAIGILIFLLADVFSDAAAIIYSGTSSAYVANVGYSLAFVLAVVGCFALLFFSEHRSKGSGLSPRALALIVAAAIGFQNLTEGLVFGATWAVGITGLLTVIFLGFFLQNVTEGFPIAAPLIGKNDRAIGVLVVLFLVGGLPTVLGGVVGYFYNSPLLDVTFDALAIGAILYCILPMLRVAFRPADTPEASYLKQRLTYLGILIGFVLGFIVNAI
jgi:zinc transporter, ZIP family